jgi:hypothetical protein
MRPIGEPRAVRYSSILVNLRGIWANGAAVLAVGLAACGGTKDHPTGAASDGGLTGRHSCGTGSGASAGSVPYAPTPDADPFYAAPDPLPNVPPGTVLNSRTATFVASGTTLQNLAWQLQYMSEDVNCNPVAAIATVVKPLVAAATTPVPLLAYQFAEDSLGSKCAPSHQVTGGTENSTSQLESVQYLPLLQTHGWTLVFPDHEGPYSEYAAGPLAGHITLDAIRAAESFDALGLSGTDTPVGMWGYSGGALATAWAAQMQPTYASELNVVGVASGGTPTDLVAASKAFDTGSGNAFFSLGFSGVVGVARAFPDMLPESILNDKGLAAVAATKDGCVGATTDGSAAIAGHFADYITVPDPFNTPGVNANAPKITLPQPGNVPTANMYFYHAENDQLVPIAGTDATVKAYCDAGAHINYSRVAGADHLVLAASGTADAVAYLASRFSGAATPVVPAGTQTCN